MEPPDPARKPSTPPAAPSGPDGDFDPDLDVAPVPRRTSARPDLAAALAEADEELRWAGATKPSEQQAYLEPTTLPRGLVAPTLDMAAIQVREDLDPRKAVTVPVGLLPPPPAIPPSAPATVSPISTEAPSVAQPAGKRAWSKLVGIVAALVVLGGVGRLVVHASFGSSELAGSATGLSPGMASVPGATRSGAGDAPGSSSALLTTSGAGGLGTSVAVGTHGIIGSSAPTVPTPKTSGTAPSPRPTFDPYADAGSIAGPPFTASTATSLAPITSPSSKPAPTTQPATPLTSNPITTGQPVVPPLVMTAPKY